ncbi:MAG: serine/threonine protein kinase, partial [Planctomycetaceae bacterium]|nr:serine/threonine protein kinase [Planctomycetaceae bacterium]
VTLKIDPSDSALASAETVEAPSLAALRRAAVAGAGAAPVVGQAPPAAEESRSRTGNVRHVVLVEGSAPHLSVETRNLLRRRLRLFALVMGAGFLAFLAWSAFRAPQLEMPLMRVAHIGVTALLAGIGWRLCDKCTFTLTQLRVAEALVVGAPALFFLLVNYEKLLYCAEVADGTAHIPNTVGAWIVLIFCYALFVPNTWRRAVIVFAVLGLDSLAVAGAAYFQLPAFAQLCRRQAFSAVVSEEALMMALTVLAATVGVHSINALRKEAFVARQLGQYRLKRTLGSGGMGEVYLAEHQMMKRPCAIKVIRPEKAGDPQVLARFEREVRATAKLSHWNSIDVFDYGRTDDGTFYYVMEYLPGLSLRHIVDRFGPLSPGRTVYLLRQVCRALSEAHATGLIHRDVKPGNIFAAERGGMFDVAKLLDFGLVKSLHPEDDSLQLTVDGTIVGSPLYAAPESTLDEKPDPRSDLYSLGATAYWLLTRKPVFDYRKPLKVLFAHANEQPQPPSIHNPDIPADLEAVIMRCLEKKRSDRYASAAELEIALGKCQCAADWDEPAARNWWRERVAAHKAPQEAAAGSASLSTRDGNQTATLARTIDHQETTHHGD